MRLLAALALAGLLASIELQAVAAEPPSTRLVYRIADGVGQPADLERLLAVVEKRCNPGRVPRAKVQRLDAQRIEVSVLWQDPIQVRRIERVLRKNASLEFGAAANTQDHADLVELARKSQEATLQGKDGQRLAWWAPLAGTLRDELKDNPDWITRQTPAGRVELLLVADRHHISQDDLQAAWPAFDLQGRPCIAVKFRPAGLERFNRLLAAQLSDATEDHKRYLAVVIEGDVTSVPVVRGKVLDTITVSWPRLAGRDDEEKMEDVAALLNSGPLAARLVQVDENKRGPSEAAGPPADDAVAMRFQEDFRHFKRFIAAGYQRASNRQPPTSQEEFKRQIEEERDAYERARLWIELVPLAETAVTRRLKACPEAADVLKMAALECVSCGDHHEGLRLANLLLDRGHQDKTLSMAAGLTAFALADFDTAEKHLGQSGGTFSLSFLGVDKALGDPFSGLAAKCRQDIPYYRKAWEREKNLRAAEIKADELPRVLLTTAMGPIEIELFEKEAPKTVAHFLALVGRDHYRRETLECVASLEMPDPKTGARSLEFGVKPAIPSEAGRPDRRAHLPGRVSLASTSSGSTGTRLSVLLVPARHLDGKDTVIGCVVKGMELLEKSQWTTWHSGRLSPVDATVPDASPHTIPILDAKILRRPKTVEVAPQGE